MDDFDVRICVDKKTGRVEAAYLTIRRGKSAAVKELADGNAYADYDKDGQLLGIELLGPCNVNVLNKIVRGQPKSVKTFVRESVPHKMIEVVAC